MRQLKHWQDPANALLGVWLVLSPWALRFDGNAVAMYNAVGIGVALVAVALGAILVPRAWEEWVEGALGLWLVVSPWALGFNAIRDAMVSTAITGLAVIVLALWTLLTDQDYRAHWRDTMAR